ncbi:hypothetical protein AHAS_Ahas12G0142900 [Arachis hypogaea]
MEMDSPLNRLLIQVWERMSWIAPVPRQHIAPAKIPVARRLCVVSGVIAHDPKRGHRRPNLSGDRMKD